MPSEKARTKMFGRSGWKEQATTGDKEQVGWRSKGNLPSDAFVRYTVGGSADVESSISDLGETAKTVGGDGWVAPGLRSDRFANE